MKNLKIIAATGVAIFTLFSSFSGAIAWFQTRRNEKAKADEFYVQSVETAIQSIRLYSFYGETTDDGTPSYTFNPSYTIIYANGEFNEDAPLVSLNPYSIEKPHHPVLVVYEISGVRTRIDLSTTYCFLGADQDFITDKTETKDELVRLENKVENAYYEVAHDETNNQNTILYQYVSGNLVNMTVGMQSALASKKQAANNNKYFRVLSDETRSGVASIYQYKHVKSDFELVWIDLGINDEETRQQTNPLSSVVDFFSLTDAEFSLTPASRTVNRESFSEQAQNYSYTETDLSCISISKTYLDDEERKHSFTNFTGSEDYDPYQEINIFDDDTTGITYVGIVIDYDQLALEYIFSRSLGHEALNYGLTFECDWITKF